MREKSCRSFGDLDLISNDNVGKLIATIPKHRKWELVVEEVGKLCNDQSDLPVGELIPLSIIAEDGESVARPGLVASVEDNGDLINRDKTCAESSSGNHAQGRFSRSPSFHATAIRPSE